MKHKIERYDANGSLIPGQRTALGVSEGGTGSNLSGSGPGVVIQETTGASLTVETSLDATRGGTEQTTVAAGDLLYGSGMNAWSKLTATTNGFFLKLVAGVPAWAAAAYQVIKSAGTPLTARAAINFLSGAGITVGVADDSGGDETEVTVTLALDIQENGVSVEATPDKLDFKDSNVEAAGSDDVHVYQDLPSLCEGRLTLSSTLSAPTADISGATTLYWLKHNGNKVSLYDGTRWKKHAITDPSIALTSLIKGATYDAFVYDNAGTLTLELIVWKKVTATNSPTAGASKVIDLADTAGLAIGMEVTVRDGSNSEVANITAVVASTSITVDALVNSYTTPDVYGYPTRVTNLVSQDGVLVKDGATDRRYLGLIRISRTATGECNTNTSEWQVANYYNRVTRYLVATDPTNTWAYSTTTTRAANASIAYGTARVGFVVAASDEKVTAVVHAPYSEATAGTHINSGGIGLDSITVDSTLLSGGPDISSASENQGGGEYAGYPATGNHYLNRLETGGGGTTTWYGDGGTTRMKSGLLATVKV